MPTTYRRWWEQPDTITTTPPDPGVPQPPAMPFWETEDVGSNLPPPITDNIPSLEAQGEPVPAGGPVSSPPGPPAPPSTPGEGVYVPGVSERLRGGQITPPAPIPPPPPTVSPPYIAQPEPMVATNEPEPIPTRTPGAFPPPAPPTSAMAFPEQGEPEPIPPEMDRPGMREGAVYVPGVSEKLWLRRVQDPDIRAQLEALIATAPTPIPQHHRDPTTEDILNARAYSESQLAPTLVGAMLLMAQVSTGAKDAILEQLRSPSGHGQLGEMFMDFWAHPAPESAVVKGIEAIGSEVDRTLQKYGEGPLGRAGSATAPVRDSIDRAFQIFSEPIAGLGTLWAYTNYTFDLSKLPDNVKALLASRLDPNASPLEALWDAGQIVYDEAPIPFLTGLMQESINPLNFVGVGLLGDVARLGRLPQLLRNGGLTSAVKGGIGVVAQVAKQLPKATREALAREGGIPAHALEESLTPKGAEDTINRDAFTPFLSALKESTGGVGAGWDPRIVKVLGGNLYRGDLGTIAAKEMVQNAVDSVRRLGSGGKVDVVINTDARTIRVVDNGHGMLPETVAKEFVDIGGSLKDVEEASGGFGLAKVAIFANSDSIEVRTVAKKGSQYIETTLRGSGEEWAARQMQMESRVLSDPTQIGTTISVKISPEASFSRWSTQQHMTGVLTGDFLPGISVTMDGNRITPLNIKPKPLQSIKVEGATIDFHASEDSSRTSLVSVGVYNNGLYQFSKDIYLPAEVDMPKAIIANVKSKLSPEHPGYPFTPSREDLRTAADEAVRGYVNNQLVKTAIKQQADTLTNAVREAPKISGGGGAVVLDTTGKLDPAFVVAVSKSAYALRLSNALELSVASLAGAIRRSIPRPFETPQYLGLGLGPDYRALYVTARQFMENRPDFIVLNPFTQYDYLQLVKARGGITSFEDEAKTMSDGLVASIVHELAHSIAKSHGEDYAVVLTDLMQHTISEMAANSNDLTGVIRGLQASGKWEEFLNHARQYGDLKPGGNIFGKASSGLGPEILRPPSDTASLAAGRGGGGRRAEVVQNSTEGREPWRMTQDQFLQANGGQKASIVEKLHERIVKEAVSEGRVVPPNVLADYPHLEKLANSGKTYSFDPTRTKGLLKVLSDDYLKGEAQYLPKQYVGEGLPASDSTNRLVLSVNPTHPQARVGQTLYDVEADIQNPAVFRTYDDFFSFHPSEGAAAADPYEFLRSAGYDSVYIPPAEGQDGWLVLLDPKKAVFHNPQEVTEELLSKNQARALAIREKRDLIRREADATIGDEAGRGIASTEGGGITRDGEPVAGGGGDSGGGSGYRALPGQGGGGDDFSNITQVFGKPNKPFDPKSWYENTTRAVQEALTDTMAGANGLVRKWEQAHPGQTIPLRMYTEALISAVYGAPEAGLSYVKGLATGLDRIMGGSRGWKGSREHLTTYLHLKNALDIWKYLPDHQVSGNIAGPEQAQRLLGLMRQSLGEDNWAKLEEGARLIIRTQDQLLQRMVDAGIVDKKVARDVRFRLPHYTPTVIVQDHEALSGVKGARNWIRRYTELGTTAPRYDPIDSVIQALMMGESRISQNKARRAIALVAEDLGMGTHVKRPAAPVARLTASEGEEGRMIFRPSPTRFDIRPGDGWTYFDGGKARTFEIDPEYRWLAQEVERLAGTSDLANPLNFIRHANEVFRQGLTTYSPSWWFTNFTRDFYTTFITNRVSPVESARSLVAAVNHVFGGGDALLTDLERRGMGMTGFHGRNPDEVARLADRHGAIVLRDPGEYIASRISGSAWDKIVGAGKLEWDGLMQTHDIISGIGRSIELANRRATAATLMRRHGIVPMETADKQVQYLAQGGVDLEKSLAEITMLTRRSTIDFRRGGYLTRALSSVFLFLNAGTQGMLIPARNIKDAIERKDYGKLAWMAGSLTATVAASQVWNTEMAKHLGQQYGMTAEDYLSEVPPDVKAGAIWFLLPPDQFDPVSGRPKPRFLTLVPRLSEWAQLIGTANYITDRIAGRDREGFGVVFKNIFGQTFPIDSPFELFPTQVGKLGMEIANNHDYFRDRPIVPEELLHRPKTEQFDEYTPQLIIDFAKAHDLSPLMVWHVVSSLGSGARSLVRMLDYANGGRKIDPRIQELANNLIALGPNREARNTFLSNLTREDQRAVLDTERVTRRPPTPPVIGDIVGSFLRTRTGGRRVIGRERAEQATGLSADQTDEVGRELAQFAALQDDERLNEEKAMSAGALTWKDWFDHEQRRGASMREQVDRLRLQFPKAAQVQKDPQAYKEWAAAMATLSGTATDQRTLGQLLNIEWRTIPITYKDAYTEEGDKVEGQPDFETYFAWRKEFLDHLTPLERDAFDSERLSHMTPREREWEDASKKLEDYFAIKSDVAGRHPEWRGREYAVSNAITGSPIYRELTNNDEYKEWQRLVSKEKTFYRLAHPDIDNLLVQYGFATKTVQDQVRERAADMDKAIIQQEKRVVERTHNNSAEGTDTSARSLLVAQSDLAALRDKKDALLGQLDHPETAREIKPPKPPQPDQPPSESLVKYQIAVSKYRAPYGQDPWIDSQVDEYLKRLNDLTFDRSKGTILRWAQLSAEDRRKIEAEANTKFRWKPLLKKSTPPLPRPRREPGGGQQ